MTEMTAAQRTAALESEVISYVRQGYTVETQSATTASLSKKKRIGWFWNIILTLLTGGLWLIVIIVRLVNRKNDTIVLTVDENGKVRRS